jgi:hypothetical protein
MICSGGVLFIDRYTRAFSSEVDTGSRKENASKQESNVDRPDVILSHQWWADEQSLMCDQAFELSSKRLRASAQGRSLKMPWTIVLPLGLFVAPVFLVVARTADDLEVLNRFFAPPFVSNVVDAKCSLPCHLWACATLFTAVVTDFVTLLFKLPFSKCLSGEKLNPMNRL